MNVLERMKAAGYDPALAREVRGTEINIALSVKSLEISLDGVKADVKAKNPALLVTGATD